MAASSSSDANPDQWIAAYIESDGAHVGDEEFDVEDAIRKSLADSDAPLADSEATVGDDIDVDHCIAEHVSRFGGKRQRLAAGKALLKNQSSRTERHMLEGWALHGKTAADIKDTCHAFVENNEGMQLRKEVHSMSSMCGRFRGNINRDWRQRLRHLDLPKNYLCVNS